MKKLKSNTVQGELTKHTNSVYICWECPITGKEMDISGEVEFNKATNNYEHEVWGENDEVLYTVIAPNY